MLTDRIVAQDIINTAFEDQSEQFGRMSPPVHVDVQYMVAPKIDMDATASKEGLNAALVSITDHGALETIMSKNGF